MRKLLFIFISLIMLVACGSDETIGDTAETESDIEIENDTEPVVETLNEQEHNLVLVDDENINVTLERTKHERIEDFEDKDVIHFVLNIENKMNRTFKFLIDDISFDGDIAEYDIGLSETEVGPEESIRVSASFTKDILEEDQTISFDEHLSGVFNYRDYDGFRNEVHFSEYIIEQ